MTLHDDAIKAVEAYESALISAQLSLVTAEGTVADQQTQIDALNTQVQSLKAQLDTLQPPLYANNFTDPSTVTGIQGAKSYAKQGVRLASNVEVVGGVLSAHARPVLGATTVGGYTLQPGDYAASMTLFKDLRIKIGSRLDLDLRMVPAWGVRNVALLWPADQDLYPWPSGGELDFAENGGGDPQFARQMTTITNHYYDSSRPNNNGQTPPKDYVHDFTKWTHIQVIWKPDLFVVSFDGVEAARFTEHVPINDQTLRLQTAIEGGGQSSAYLSQPRNPGRIDMMNLKIYKA